MKGLCLGLILATQAVGYAAAADLPDEIASYSWTQCYVGVHGGALWGSENWLNQTPGGAYFGQSLGGHDVDGLMGGGQAGCDYQFSGGLVVGFKGDYAWSDADGNHPSSHETGVTYGSEVKSLATVNARLGYAMDRALGYVKGGIAWERDEEWASTTILGLAYQGEETRSGWAFGAGVEYAITQSISGFAEYVYYDYGSEKIGLAPQINGLPPAFVDLDEDRSAVRVGINFRFGG
jgi:outer membrane immunogenic protein